MDPKDTNNAYLPIEDYGIVGDLNTVALIGLTGSIDFMCFPDFDSPTLFAALLDNEKGGRFQLHPKDAQIRYKQLYLPDTNILLTRFLSDNGIGELTDFMPVQAVNRGNELIRRVTTLQGEITYSLSCTPRFNYATSAHVAQPISDKELIFQCDELNVQIRLKSSVPLTIQDNDVSAEFTLAAGETADFILSYVDKASPELKDLQQFVSDSLMENINYWQNWTEKSNYHGRWREIVNRSALILKLMTSYKYGSLVAAPTFGLPEEIGGERNWDYRYTWIRDASFTIYCLLQLGYTKEAGDFINWVATQCFDVHHKQNLQLMYKIDGSRGLTEKILDNLSGYCDSKPVRIGNGAYQQLQLDIYGELMDAVYQYDKDGEPISYELWTKLSSQIDWLSKNWTRKDEGIWEVRGGEKEFLYSKIMCWVAFDRAIKIGINRSYPFPETWMEQRNQIFNTIHQDYYSTKLNSFVQYKNAETVDAAALLMPIIGFISPKDPKWLSTLECIEEKLVADFLVYRYRNQENLDGLHGGEGTFSMCTFWYVQCLGLSGQTDKARLYFEKMLGYANHLGLFAEQLGSNGQHLGNYPQAFTHLGLISAALSLSQQLESKLNK
ncbi:glycoside hydrolase family 15 protein [Mucilaginibacter robiniae]|uniref:Glycoside hydrolase family 15 protein n=1 Tax=Mucilaginibacter robiniae TaxID=2728022 RepID=A0A7L5E4E6_9SPHI|nr:glycoside hydrolase family 15 protein [Mucilaginibacter robiniae]QJD97911.1 glycoside hydrolase family 15 protein [Mucilaginibacter robiniae]